MTVTVTHAKTNNVTDWTQAELDAQIAAGNYPAGTTLADITLPSDWNDGHTITGLATVASTGSYNDLSDKPSLSSYVPYTGATSDVDLGNNSLNAKSLNVTGTAGNGHIHLKHQSADASATGSSTVLFANSSGNIKYKNDGGFYTTFVTSANTADRAYTFPDQSGTVALRSDLSFATVEKNLGSNPRRSGKFTITGLSGLTIGKPVNIFQAVAPYTGKGTLVDEAEMDGVSVSASVTATNTITAYWNSATRVRGNFKFNYLIGA